MAEQSQKVYHQYFSTRPRISIVMENANRIYFQGGQYITARKDEIEFLDKEVELGNSMIYKVAGKETVTEEQLDPLAAIKAKAIAEYLEQQQKQQDPSRDMGNTANTGAGVDVATSKSIGAITVGSGSKAK